MTSRRPILHGLAGATAVVAALALTACSSSGSDPNAPVKLSFVQGFVGDEFYITMKCGVEAEARKLGVEVSTQGPQAFDPTLQKPIVDSAAATRPTAMIVAPADTSAMQAPLKAAASQGIKMVLVDTTTKDPSYAASQIASDNTGGGTEAFKGIQQLNPAGGKVLVMSTDPGISTLDARIQGFENAAKADPRFQYLGVQYSHNDPATAARLLTAALAKDPDIVGVFATNTQSAAGTGTGVRQAGKQAQVKVVGFDAGPDQVEQLRDGTVQALIAQDPTLIGADGVDQAVAASRNQPVTPTIQTGFHLLTRDNIDADGKQYVYRSTC